MNPEIYLLDEPFSSLDPKNREFFISKLRKLDKENKTILLISQELDYIPDIFTRAIVLNKGKIIFDGSIDKLYTKAEILHKANLRIPFLSQLFQKLLKEDYLPQSHSVPTNINTALVLLRKILKNPEIKQKGSNITPERLRYDFNFDRKLTDKEIKAVETEVNKQIKKGIEITKEEVETKKAVPMDKNKAFNIISQVCSQYKGNLQEHTTIQEALRVLMGK